MLVFSFSFKPQLIQAGDASFYTMLGMSLAQGKGLCDISQPSALPIHWWPAGFPLFISLYYLIIGAKWILLIGIIFALLYASIFLFGRTLLTAGESLLDTAFIVLAVCFSSNIHLLSSYLYSETFFLAFSLLFFFLWQKWKCSLSWIRILALSLFALYIALIRNIGLALPIALGMDFLLGHIRREKSTPKWGFWVPFILTMTYILFILLSPGTHNKQLESYFIEQKASAVSTAVAHHEKSPLLLPIKSYSEKLVFSFRGYALSLIPQALVRSAYDLAPMSKQKAILMALLSLFVFWGWLTTFKKWRLLNIYTGVFILALLAYGPLYDRLLIPIVPFLLFYLYFGFKQVAAFLIKREKRLLIVLCFFWLLVVSANAYKTFSTPRKTMPAEFGDEEYQQCVEWVIQNAKPKEVVASEIYAYLFLRRGSFNVPFEETTNPEEFLAYLNSQKVKYLMISPFCQRRGYTYFDKIHELENKYPDQFKNVFGDRPTYVLEYIP